MAEPGEGTDPSLAGADSSLDGTDSLQGGTDSSPATTDSWEEQARKAQQSFLQTLGNRIFDAYRRKLPSICQVLLTEYCKCLENDELCSNDSEMVVLKSNIGFAVYGFPTENPSEENGFTGYPTDKMKTIETIFHHICTTQTGDKILMSTIYIILEKTGKDSGTLQVPIFRIPNLKTNNPDEYCFVDFTGRLYKNWKDFLNNNKLPGSKCCYPAEGVYSGNDEGCVVICFGKTPAAQLSGTVVRSVDMAATVASVGAGVGAFFPPIALPCAAACGIISVYSAVRGSVELADRGTHGQSLANREAARQWLSIAGSVLGLGSSGGTAALKIMARQGRNISDVVCGAVTGLNVSSFAVNGVSLVENFWTIKEQEEWDAFQCFQFVVSVGFFAHSVANFKTANSVISETQTQILDDHGSSLSKRSRKLFEGIQKETLKGEDPVVGRSKIIKDLNYLSNKNEFYAQIRRSNKTARNNFQPIQKIKFGGLAGPHEGSTGHGQTSSPLGVNVRPTVAYSESRATFPSTSCVQSHEPLLATAIKEILSKFSIKHCVNELLENFSKVFDNFPYGRQCLTAIRIVVDIYNCHDVTEAMYIVEQVIELWKSLVEERYRRQRNSSHSSTEGESNHDSSSVQTDIEEIMSELVEDVEFIPSHLSMESEGEVYHFPSDHRSWGENGELAPEDYVLIAQNFLGISNLQCCNIMQRDDTANVYIEHVGLLTITSFKRDQKVVLKLFKKQVE